jgi:hypothetical protein
MLLDNTNNTMTNENLKKQLQNLIKNEKTYTIKRAVAEEALENEDIKYFFSELSTYGCVSGNIYSLCLIDTYSFYNTYYDEIEELIREHDERTGYKLITKGDCARYLTWFAIEEVAHKIAIELNLEI